jgi:hypothetical protein
LAEVEEGEEGRELVLNASSVVGEDKKEEIRRIMLSD